MRKIIGIMTLLVLVALFSSAKGRKVLFIGDSITDGAWGNSKVWNTPSEGRDHNDMNHIYGHGYMMICASCYQALHPMDEYTFWNRGISGNTLADLHGRWCKDALCLQPDVISILVGTNDADRVVNNANAAFDIEAWDKSYRKLLDTTLQSLPDVKFVLCTPFVANVGRLKGTPTFPMRAEIISKMDSAIRKIAADYNATLVPFDSLFDELLSTPSPSETYWIWDGIHPTPAAHYRMAQLWMEKANL